VSFKPDYGLQLTNAGISRDVDHFFYDFRLYSLSVLGNGQYSTFVNFPSDGKYALSLDLNQQQLEQILAAAPPEIVNFFAASFRRTRCLAVQSTSLGKSRSASARALVRFKQQEGKASSRLLRRKSYRTIRVAVTFQTAT
jgi:hypothetical protein